MDRAAARCTAYSIEEAKHHHETQWKAKHELLRNGVVEDGDTGGGV